MTSSDTHHPTAGGSAASIDVSTGHGEARLHAEAAYPISNTQVSDKQRAGDTQHLGKTQEHASGATEGDIGVASKKTSPKESTWLNPWLVYYECLTKQVRYNMTTWHADAHPEEEERKKRTLSLEKRTCEALAPRLSRLWGSLARIAGKATARDRRLGNTWGLEPRLVRLISGQQLAREAALNRQRYGAKDKDFAENASLMPLWWDLWWGTLNQTGRMDGAHSNYSSGETPDELPMEAVREVCRKMLGELLEQPCPAWVRQHGEVFSTHPALGKTLLGLPQIIHPSWWPFFIEHETTLSETMKKVRPAPIGNPLGKARSFDGDVFLRRVYGLQTGEGKGRGTWIIAKDAFTGGPKDSKQETRFFARFLRRMEETEKGRGIAWLEYHVEKGYIDLSKWCRRGYVNDLVQNFSLMEMEEEVKYPPFHAKTSGANTATKEGGGVGETSADGLATADEICRDLCRSGARACGRLLTWWMCRMYIKAASFHDEDFLEEHTRLPPIFDERVDGEISPSEDDEATPGEDNEISSNGSTPEEDYLLSQNTGNVPAGVEADDALFSLHNFTISSLLRWVARTEHGLPSAQDMIREFPAVKFLRTQKGTTERVSWLEGLVHLQGTPSLTRMGAAVTELFVEESGDPPVSEEVMRWFWLRSHPAFQQKVWRHARDCAGSAQVKLAARGGSESENHAIEGEHEYPGLSTWSGLTRAPSMDLWRGKDPWHELENEKAVGSAWPDADAQALVDTWWLLAALPEQWPGTSTLRREDGHAGRGVAHVGWKVARAFLDERHLEGWRPSEELWELAMQNTVDAFHPAIRQCRSMWDKANLLHAAEEAQQEEPKTDVRKDRLQTHKPGRARFM